MTEWRAIPGFSDYAVSADGGIRPIKRSPFHPNVDELKLTVDAKGYKRTSLVGDDGRMHRVSAHIAVLEAFVGPRPKGHDASHLNGIRTDARLINLCWETSSANHQRKLAHGTLIHGERHKCSKLKVDQVRDIRARAARGEAPKRLASIYGVSDTLVYLIVARKAWKHAA